MKLMAIRVSLFACVTLIAIGVPSRGQERDKDSVGVIVSKSGNTKEIGLPIYPGSKPHKESNDSGGAKLGLWAGGSGFNLNVMKMETPDAPHKVAEFYKKALSKYGKVLDCTNGRSESEDKNSKALTCGDDKPEKGGMVFKAGTKDRQHIVAIEPQGKATVYNLVYINVQGGDTQ